MGGALLGVVGLPLDEVNSLGKGALFEIVDRNLPKTRDYCLISEQGAFGPSMLESLLLYRELYCHIESFTPYLPAASETAPAHAARRRRRSHVKKRGKAACFYHLRRCRVNAVCCVYEERGAGPGKARARGRKGLRWKARVHQGEWCSGARRRRR